MTCGAGRQAFVGIFRHGMGGKGYDRSCQSIVRLFPLPDRANRRISIHHRHLYIHEYDIELTRLKLFDGNGPVLGHFNRMSSFS